MPDITFCQMGSDNGADCRRPAMPAIPIPICQLHALVVYHAVLENSASLVHMLGVARLGGSTAAKDLQNGRRFLPNGDPLECVYYIRFGDRIKIGTTKNLLNRLVAIPYDEVLAIEPGGFGLESLRHKDFGAHRINGEWFNNSPEILAHINLVRAVHGMPLAAWDSWRKNCLPGG